jgi:hypothetical protein
LVSEDVNDAMRKFPIEHALAVLKREPWQLADPMFTEEEAITYLEGYFNVSLGNDAAAWERVVTEYLARKRREWLALDDGEDACQSD